MATVAQKEKSKLRWSLFVPGEPLARAEKRTTFIKSGRTIHGIGDKPEQKAYKVYVKDQIALSRPQRLLDGALALCLTIYRTKPKSAPKSRIWPITKPDLTNYQKLAEDCLKSLVIVDDALVVQAYIEKRYADEENPPGISFEVEEL